MTYREHPVPPALRRAVACGWTLEVGDVAVPGWRVLPDGYMDLVAVGDTPVALAGPATTVQLVDLPAGGGVAGLRLLPGSAQALFGVPAHAVRDLSPALTELWPDPGMQRDEEAVRTIADPTTRLRGLCELLAARLPQADDPDDAVRHAVALIHAGNPTVDILADRTNLTSRQLLRRFDAAVGYGPKRLQRVVRLQRALAEHQRDPAASTLAGLAAHAGYADQAHLTRDWVRLTGTTPAALLATRDVDLTALTSHAAG